MPPTQSDATTRPGDRTATGPPLEFLRAVLDAATGPMVLLDEASRVRVANRAFLEAFGLAVDAAEGSPFRELVGGGWEPGEGVVELDREAGGPGRRTLRIEARGVEPGAGPPGWALVSIAGASAASAPLPAGDRQFREVADASPAILWVTDPTGHCTFLSRRWGEVTGQPIEEGHGLGWTEMVHPDDRGRSAAAFLASNSGRTTFAVDYRLRQADGSYRWALDAGHPRFDAEGEYLGIVGIVVDIEDRSRAERALALTRQRLDYAARAAGVGFWYCDLPFDVLEWDERVKAHFHLPPDAPVTIDTFYDRMHPEDREPTRRAIDRSIAGRTPYAVEFRTVDLDGGRTKWIRAVGGAAYAPDGSPVTFDGLTLDVTERKQFEERLARGERQFREMTNASPQVVWTATPDGVLDFVSEQFFQATGLTWDGDGPVDWTPAIHPDDLSQTIRAWTRSIAAGEPYEVQQRIWDRREGRHRWHLTRSLPVRDERGRVAKWLGTNTDIDDQKRSEAAAAAARDEAEAANRMKDEFLATLSHELRTPLNAIVGWSKILRSGGVDPEDLDEGLAAIERNGMVQSQLIEDLLDVSRIVSGNLRLDLQRINIAEAIDAAVAAVAPAAAARSIRLLRTLDSLVGPVTGDFARLQQIVWNLVSNAVKFTPKGGKVQVLLERVESHVEISVVDNGLGIRPEFLPHVFDRFRQADGSSTRRHGGLGLGLAIVKHLVEMHGGSVRAESPGEGRGSTFVVTLPLTVVHAERVEPPLARARREAAGGEAPSRAGSLRGLKVLVVDDEQDARQLIRRVLADCDAEVLVASSAFEAIRLVQSGRPDVLVSDIGMPDQDGYDLIEQVRRLFSGRELPAAALTAFARAEDRKRALLAGFQTHLAKPVDPAELAAVVASLAGRTGGPA